MYIYTHIYGRCRTIGRCGQIGDGLGWPFFCLLSFFKKKRERKKGHWEVWPDRRWARIAPFFSPLFKKKRKREKKDHWVVWPDRRWARMGSARNRWALSLCCGLKMAPTLPDKAVAFYTHTRARAHTHTHTHIHTHTHTKTHAYTRTHTYTHI